MSRERSGFILIGDITPDADNARNLGSSTQRFAAIYTAAIKNEGLQNFVAPLYGMTSEPVEASRDTYGSHIVAFQFRPIFDCLWAGVRLALRYIGSPSQLRFRLYRWNGSDWNYIGALYISTSDCGSYAVNYPTLVTKLLSLGNRVKLDADNLYEIRVDCESGDASNYWRLYYDDNTPFREWKGRDCVGYRISDDGGSSWTGYSMCELSVQVLVGPDV